MTNVANAATGQGPQPIGPGSGHYQVDEDETLVFSQANGNRLFVPDHGDLPVTITLSVEDGSLRLADTSGLFRVSGDGTSQVTLAGTSAAVNAALDGLAYTGAQDANGTRHISITAYEPVSGNLIVNGGAEDGPSDQYYDPTAPQGWQARDGALTAASYPSGAGYLDDADSAAVGGGDDYFYGGGSGSGSIFQRIDVSARMQEIDEGGMAAGIEGLFGGLANQPDAMKMTVRFLGSMGQELGNATIGGIGPADRDYETRLIEAGTLAQVPIGTRSIEVVLTATGYGDVIDGYADNLSLVLSAPQTAQFDIDIVPMPEWVYGTELDETMTGTDDIDFLDGAGGNDILYGMGGNDRLSGGSGDDRLVDSSGVNRFDGGAGEDTVVIDRTGVEGHYTVYLGEDGSGSDSGGSTFTAVEKLIYRGATGSDTVFGGFGDDVVYGQGGSDDLRGGSGNDELSGGEGYDVLDGGEGNDRLSGGTDGGSFDGGAGHDWAEIDAGQSTGTNVLGDTGDGSSFTLSDGTMVTNIEQLTYTGGSGRDEVHAGAFVDYLHGGGGNDALYGGGGSDELYGDAGNDLLDGGEGADDLYGGDGRDTLDGGAGADDLTGGAGNDTYIIDNAGDQVVEFAGDGIDTVVSSLGETVLGANVENLTMTGAAYWGTGNKLANVMIGTDAGSRLFGGAGGDTLYGGADADQLEGEDGNDTLFGGGGYDGLYGGAGNDVIDGGEGEDLMRGGAGNDTLRGGGGDDELYDDGGVNSFDGGEGRDYAVIDVTASTGTNILGDTSGGLSTYVLSDGTRVTNVEQIVYYGGSGADRVRGGAFYDEISGAAGNDTLLGGAGWDQLSGGEGDDFLDGGSGDDSMYGGTGNDVYVVDSAEDHVSEGANEGIDRVESSVGYSLAVDIDLENLTLTGSEGIDGVGNDRANILIGNAAGNRLDGGLGADWMEGGKGNDTYIVDNAGDRVRELADGGIDGVWAYLSYSIAGQHVENLFLAGQGADRGTGNGLDNWLIGNNSDNILNGGGGADRLIGQAGNDRYIVDNAGDVVTEQAGEGVDRVDSRISYALADNVENLVLTGNAVITGTGNGLANTIVGNSAGNIIDGGAGADIMEGKTGNDRYVVDDAGDKVFELAGGGTDTVDASVSYSLAGQYVETLRLTGSGAIDATGNNQANSLYGNAAANVIKGAGGDDKLYGGDGSDTLSGGTGLDRFVFDTALHPGGNVDRILDFSSKDDGIYLDRSIFTAIGAGTLSAGAFVNGAAAVDASDRIVYDQASGNIFYDADGSGAGAAMLFANVGAGTIVTNADFIGF